MCNQRNKVDEQRLLVTMKSILIFLLLFCNPLYIKGQNKRSSYTQYGFSIPFRENTDTDSEDWFIPDGFAAKLGGGFHFNKRIVFGINTGLDWVYSKKLVTVPVYGTIKLSSKIQADTYFFLQGGYGESIFIGRQGRTGDYKKFGLGIEGEDGFGLSFDFTQYGIYLQEPQKIWTISVGITISQYKIRN